MFSDITICNLPLMKRQPFEINNLCYQCKSNMCNGGKCNNNLKNIFINFLKFTIFMEKDK